METGDLKQKQTREVKSEKIKLFQALERNKASSFSG